MGIYLPVSALPNLKKYKYGSEDHSLVAKYILRPFWAKFVLIFPTWMAPNMITLLGLGFIIINLLTVIYYDPTLTQPSPSWVYFTYGIGIFFYQTFDACDGSHARRTGQSGPLGELFDHCVDAVNTTLGGIIFASTTGMGYSPLLLISQFATQCNFYLSTWEEYHTGVLYLSAISGPVEGILLIAACHFVSGIWGPQVWTTPFVDLFNIDVLQIENSTLPGQVKQILKVLTPTETYVVLGAFGLLFNILSASDNVVKFYRKQNKPAYPALRGIIPFFVYYSAVFLFVMAAPSIMETDILPYIFQIGATAAFTVGRIITAHLTLQSFPYFNILTLFPLLQIVAYYIFTHIYSVDSALVANKLVWFGFGTSVGVYGSFVMEVITEITTYLDIWCLSIKHKKIE